MMSKLPQRKCQICNALYTPIRRTQKYGHPACREHARKLQSIKRDAKRDLIHIVRRIDELLGN